MEIIIAVTFFAFACGFILGLSHREVMTGRKGRARRRMAHCNRCNRIEVYNGRSFGSEADAIHTFTHGG